MANARFNNSIREAASYRFYSLSGYKAIMESQGYQCYQKPDDETSIYFARDGVEQGAMDVAHIERLKALALSEEDSRRARQLKFIFRNIAIEPLIKELWRSCYIGISVFPLYLSEAKIPRMAISLLTVKQE